MEPTRNAWVPLAAWLGARGATVVLVAPERSADLRDYYAKHTKTDRLDSRMLARLPLLHPQDLEPLHGLDPAGTFKRTVRRRWSLVERRHACCQRLDALVEMLGPLLRRRAGCHQREVAEAQGRAIVAERYRISDEVRQARRTTSKAKKLKGWTSRRSQKSTGAAPASGPPTSRKSTRAKKQIYPGKESRLNP